MGTRSITIGILGAGYWGPNLIRSFAETPGCEVRYVCDLRQDLLAKIAKRFQQVNVTTRFDDLLNDPEVDGIVIATPAATHADLAARALNAGKHVLVEKPLAHEVEAGEKLVRLAEAQKRILMVGHTFEFNPAVRKLKDIIRDPAFGDVVYLYSRRVNLGVLRQDVNSLWNLAPHDVSIILFLFEEYPRSVIAHGLAHIRKGVEDVAFMYLEFPSGKIAHVHVSWLDPSKVRTMTVIGSRRMVVYDDVDPETRLKIYDRGFEIESTMSGIDHSDPSSYTYRVRSGDIIAPHIEWKEPLALECRHFVETVREGGVPLTDGHNGLRVVRVLAAATASMHQNGRRIEVPAPVKS
ncbi:MAG: Gfo/Idh/MocA family oxidoreductase [Nitrospira sp.]|nr:Gfo/Idh/MocA family oxidoreductase [Nitrospira sp.]